ncbi:MAG: hypothetical protein HYZ29_23120 [Myxococcales bacterium]|nr:hypothetical protein [Myxococcales bacterium]
MASHLSLKSKLEWTQSWRWFAAVLVAAALPLSSCSDGADSPRAKQPAEPAASEWSIKIFVGEGASAKRVDLRPVRELGFGDQPLAQAPAGKAPGSPAELMASGPPKLTAAGGAAGTKNPGPGSKPQAVIGSDDGGAVVEQELSGISGWALVYGAAAECGFPASRSVVADPGANPHLNGPPVVPPWDLGSWSIFPGGSSTPAPPQSCDQQIAYNDALLCVANELSAVADAVSTIRWTRVAAMPPLDGLPTGPWKIPVQSNKDRFIARDLAIYLLATLAMNDMAPIPGSTEDACSGAYARAAKDGQFGTANASWLFGSTIATKYFPDADPNITLATVPAIAELRLRYQTQVLRTASRLLDELIDKSVEADLAGAAKRRARATDHVRGSEIAWGQRDNANGRYNTLAHAVRVVAGRWELSPVPTGNPFFFTSDPKCGGVPVAEAVEKGYGADLDARIRHQGLRTPGQKLATEVIQGAGIIVPTDKIGQAREAVHKQLVEVGALANGFAATDPVYAGELAGKSVGYVMNDLTDGDLTFALEASFQQYQLLTNQGSSAAPTAALSAGLKPGHVSTDLASLGAIALEGGMPRQDLATDFTARVGTIQQLGQCDEFGGAIGQIYASTAVRTAFQDSYSIGQTLQRRLVVLREAVREQQLSLLEDALKQSEDAAGEVRAWTGPGRVIATSLPSDSGGPGAVWIATLGFEPSDFAASTAAEMQQQLVLVHGPAWVADCAARLRSSCPEGFADKYVAKPVYASVTQMDAGMRRATGFDGTYGVFAFNAGSVPQFQPKYLGSTSSPENLYVVQLHDPSSPGAKGKVLGALALRHPLTVGANLVGGTATSVSAKQQQHLNAILGLSKSHANTIGIGLPGVSEGPVYCNGMPKDLFVPLENELTSDSDQYENSFRHYLTVARQAAVKADALGEELIKLGLDQDFRREAAQEDLAEICGDYTSLDQVEVNNGKVSAPDGDQNLKNCLAEDKYDLVFLTDDPLKQLSAKEKLDFAKARLGCAEKPANPLCGAVSVNGPKNTNTIETGALGLSPYVGPSVGGAPGKCDVVAPIPASLKDKFAGNTVKDLAVAEWMHDPQLEVLASTLSVEVDPTGEWRLKSSGEAKMDSSKQDDFWPGCRRTGYNCKQGGVADLFDQTFRRLAAGGPKTLGSSEGPGASLESSFILWRVQGAVWLLGAMSGTIPSGMFNTQVPAANFNASWPTVARAPVPTVYGTSRYKEDVSQPGTYWLDSGNIQGDQDWMGALVPGSFKWYNTYDISTEIPLWLTDLYSAPAGRYLHAAAKNKEVTGFDSKDLAAWLQQQGLSFDGMTCEQGGLVRYTGDPDGGPTASHEKGRAAVEALRRGKNWGKLCSRPLEGGTLWLDVDKNREAFTSFWDVGWMPGGWGNGYDRAKQVIPYFPDSEPDPAVKGLGLLNSFSLRSTVDVPLSQCRHPKTLGGTGVSLGTTGLQWIDASCTNDVLEAMPFPNDGVHAARYTRRLLGPQVCGPADRAQIFVNSYPPMGACGAAAQLAQAMVLACNLSIGGALGQITSRPKLETIEHIDAFVLWIDYLSKQAGRQVSNITLEQLPKSVVDDFTKLKVGGGESKGQHGIFLLELANSLRSLDQGWNNVSGDLGQLYDAVGAARNSIRAAKIQDKKELANLAIQRLNIHANMVGTAAGFLGSFSLGDVGTKPAAAAVNAAAQLGFGTAMLFKTKELEVLAAQDKDNKIEQALNQLALSTGPVYTHLKNSLSEILVSATNVANLVEQLRMSEAKANYQAAKGSGADYVVDPNGKVVKLPVNTVQRRLYSIKKKRYEAAVKEAKYLAYVARLAVEQRLGARLSTFKEKVGPLEPPQQWADDVCDLTGIDYEKLRKFEEPDGGQPTELESAEADVINDFVDQYIGDYVDKLENFVEYYNIEYPSHDGDDTAVVSLRDDLLGPPGACVKEGPNLLLFSDDLTGHDFVSDGNASVERGWDLDACGAQDAYCLRVTPQGAVATPPAPPEIAPVGGFSWLHDVPAAAAAAVDGGAGDAGSGDAGSGGFSAPRTVSQAVELVAGSSYVLSWWDQARNADGGFATQDSPAYRVAIVDPNGKEVAHPPIIPFRPASITDKVQWSERRTLEVKAAQSGTHRVVIWASHSGTPGSVLIANLQLEQAAPGSKPTAYAHTGASRLQVTSQCSSASPESLQQAFKYACDTNKQCYYELVAPIAIDTTQLASGNSRLAGKLAAGNFNFRHITLALNLVGTGVYDCTANPSQSCFGSAFVEYSIDHDAFSVPVLPRDGIAQIFNFGSAGINHGKALAAEKYVTLPIGSGDQNLLAQPGIEKPEYRGRPLDGSYRLRIWDSPYLMWNRIEDIQLVLKYRYWSRIQPQPAP